MSLTVPYGFDQQHYKIEEYNPQIDAAIGLNSHALEYADKMDKVIRTKNITTGLLFYLPILLKDNYDTIDMKTTRASMSLKDFQPKADAPPVKVLRDAETIILGKANLHELALEGISVSSYAGQTLNPHDLTRTPGGSSGGTGAAIAASFAVFGTGTDTVYQLVEESRPIGRSLEDGATALTVMANIGYDPRDNTTALVPKSVVGADYPEHYVEDD
ncbi:hypothetical protein PAAG_11939 [Paracoccidioides lutzii Pb01]|uniref:Amidase domain-containing protein n=1 Tax=Paracoccidioides lutzii (strain ATCC MYA-826 / Pb01) TaxID=502779 RepID=A0A0A2V0M8_PARBA|nr:hypothetical protein PAAG_11939 [Paracoccidioides lutzii Pb01]KGQ01361.1 hypothetical protein PAAG_11939 [Paracoccidioides lutzii Pb01]